MSTPASHRRAPLAAVLALAALLAAAVAYWLPSTGPQPAPAVEFQFLDGTRATPASLRARALLINFWSLTCAPCLEELPELIRLHEEWKARGLVMVAVAMPYDPPLYVQNFAHDKALPYAVALDVQGEVSRAFAVAYVPMTFVIDADGRIVYQQTGKLDMARVPRILDALLDTSRER